MGVIRVNDELFGGGCEVIQFGAGTGTTSRTFELPKTPKLVIMNYFEGNNDNGWGSQYTLIWGSPRAYGTAHGSAPTIGGEVKDVSVSYGDDGKSFTITATNAGSALNYGTGHGFMFVIY